MPFYRYTAQDATGKAVSGALDAATPDAAAQRLIGMGLGRVAVEGAGSSASTPTRPAAAPARPMTPQSRTTSASPNTGSRTASVAPVANPVSTTRAQREAAWAAPPEEYVIPIASDKQRSFFFDQLGRFLNSGIAANRALETLAGQQSGRTCEFLHNAARNAAAGNGIGESLRGGFITEAERDALTASERGGYVPQACSRLSDIAMDAHRMNRGFAYPLVMICLALFAGPCTRGAQDGALNAISAQDKANGSLSPVGTVMAEWGKTAPTTIPLGILFIALFLLSLKVWRLPFNRRIRHRLSLKMWPLAPRARSEGMSQLASHLAALSSAGIPANESARLAAATIPNLLLREETGQLMNNIVVGTPLSQAISRSPLVSAQYRDMVANGELTGDVPGALGMVARVEEGEYINRSKFAGKGLFVMLTFLTALLVAVYVGVSAKYWYINLIKLLTSGD